MENNKPNEMEAYKRGLERGRAIRDAHYAPLHEIVEYLKPLEDNIQLIDYNNGAVVVRCFYDRALEISPNKDAGGYIVRENCLQDGIYLGGEPINYEAHAETLAHVAFMIGVYQATSNLYTANESTKTYLKDE